MPAIYTDGHSENITADQARALQMVGICEPHPGAGSDGIVQDDLKLHAHHSWSEVYSLLRDMPSVRTTCWSCGKTIEPDKAERALCADCSTGGYFGGN